MWDSVYAVGCPLGNDPIPSRGEVSRLRNELDGENYWMINAPTYFGNSGGGDLPRRRPASSWRVLEDLYPRSRQRPVVIPHMGLLTPMPAIYTVARNERSYDFALEQLHAPRPAKPIRSIDHLATPPR